MTKKPEPTSPIEWSHQMIHGVGGLIDFKRYEHAFYSCVDKCPDKSLCEAAYWIVRCLTTEENRPILNEIIKRSDLRRKESRQ